jgi:hypothetical protein
MQPLNSAQYRPKGSPLPQTCKGSDGCSRMLRNAQYASTPHTLDSWATEQCHVKHQQQVWPLQPIWQAPHAAHIAVEACSHNGPAEIRAFHSASRQLHRHQACHTCQPWKQSTAAPSKQLNASTYVTTLIYGYKMAVPMEVHSAWQAVHVAAPCRLDSCSHSVAPFTTVDCIGRRGCWQTSCAFSMIVLDEKCTTLGTNAQRQAQVAPSASNLDDLKTGA